MTKDEAEQHQALLFLARELEAKAREYRARASRIGRNPDFPFVFAFPRPVCPGPTVEEIFGPGHTRFDRDPDTGR